MYLKKQRKSGKTGIIKSFSLVIFVFALMFGGMIFTGSTDNYEGEKRELLLDIFEDKETEEIYLTVKYSSVAGMCGIVFEIKYPSNGLGVVDVTSLNDTIECTSHINEGSAIILIDGEENIQGACDIAIIRFTKKQNVDFEAEIRAIPFGDEYAYAFDDDGSLVAANIDFSKATATYKFKGEADSSKDMIYNEIIEIKTEIKEDKVGISLFGVTSCIDAFAAGFKIYVVDISKRIGEEFYTLGVIEMQDDCFAVACLRTYEKSILLSRNKRYCLVITPVIYTQKNSRLGDKQLLLIDNGEIVPSK